MEVAFEEGAGVLEVLFGVGVGDALKRFVIHATLYAPAFAVRIFPTEAPYLPIRMSCSSQSRFFFDSGINVMFLSLPKSLI